MTVQELIEELEQYDPDSEVKTMQQPSWPFEYSIAGVVSREEFGRREDEEVNTDEEDTPADIFILEGTQLCYGSKNAWES